MLSFLPFSRFYAHFLPASLRCVVGGFTLVLEVGGVLSRATGVLHREEHVVHVDGFSLPLGSTWGHF